MKAVAAAAHVHSNWSYDGIWTISEISVAFRAFGFDAVLMAEHDRGFTAERWRRYVAACSEASKRILVVPGLEYSDPDDVVHVTVWGSENFLGEGIPTHQLLESAAGEGAVAVLAHPVRRQAWERVERTWFDHLAGVELWNRRYDGAEPSSVAPEVLAKCPRGLGLFAADFHSVRDLSPLTMNIEVEGAVSPETIVEALRQRRAQGVMRPTRGASIRRLALGCAHKARVLGR